MRQLAMPPVQRAMPLGQGTLPLLARQLLLQHHTAASQQRMIPRSSLSLGQVVVSKPAVPSTVKPIVVVSKPAVPTSAEPAVPANKKTTEATKPAPPQVPPKPTPKKYLQDLFAEHEIGEDMLPKRYSRGDFVKPGDKECKSYDEAALLVRTNELDKLRSLHEEGKNLDACNRVGESLLHLACRRGHVEVAEFLMNEAKVRWDLQDDFGRTILHDACWRPSPSIELMEAILKVVSPEWLMASDIRGHTPFDYARREHMATWYDFLKEREDMLVRRLKLLS